LCLLFFIFYFLFSFFLQRILGIAFQKKENLFLSIFVVFVGKTSQFGVPSFGFCFPV